MMDRRSAMLEDRIAVVTGGASGIGQAIAIRLAHHGADIVVADVQRRPRDGSDSGDGRLTDEVIVTETARNATFVSCDVRSVPALDRTVEAADQYGGVDIMVTSAGRLILVDPLEATEREFDEELARREPTSVTSGSSSGA